MPGQSLPLNLCKSSAICGICVQLCLGLGCAAVAKRGERPAMFEPAALRINPTFTRLRAGDDQRQRVESDVELLDAAGDLTKGGGGVYFELFQYQPEGVDVRGEPVGGPAFYDLSTRGDQDRHWQRVSRTYHFRLPFDGLTDRGRYVLAATYEPRPGQGGQRLFDRFVVLPGREEKP